MAIGNFELLNSYYKNALSGIAKPSIALKSSNALTQAVTPANTNASTSFLGKLGNFANPNVLAGVGAGLSAFQAFSGYMQGKKALKEQRRVNDMLERQYEIENKRYDERKREQDEANKIIADSAKLYTNIPSNEEKEKKPSNLPMDRV